MPSGRSGPSSPSSGSGGSGGSVGQTANTDTAQQIDADQAAIDAAQATLVEAQQSLAEGTLASPIAGTVASVGIAVGDTVSADSTSYTIEVIGTSSFEISGSLTSTQAGQIHVGEEAIVTVDGTSSAIIGTVARVGPVDTSTSGDSYPIVVALPATAHGFFSGATAELAVVTGTARNVLTVPTSALHTSGGQTYVLRVNNGRETTTRVRVGVIGLVLSQIRSGLRVGTDVVLADPSQQVPSSNSTTLGGGFSGGGFSGGGLSGGGPAFSRTAGG